MIILTIYLVIAMKLTPTDVNMMKQTHERYPIQFAFHETHTVQPRKPESYTENHKIWFYLLWIPF